MSQQVYSDNAAFPQPGGGEKGLTIREYFAARALQGVLTTSNLLQADPDHLAKKAVDYADALLRELTRRKGSRPGTA